MTLAAGLVLIGLLVSVSTMLLALALSSFDEKIPGEIPVSLPVEREPIGDPLDADWRHLPL